MQASKCKYESDVGAGLRVPVHSHLVFALIRYSCLLCPDPMDKTSVAGHLRRDLSFWICVDLDLYNIAAALVQLNSNADEQAWRAFVSSSSGSGSRRGPAEAEQQLLPLREAVQHMYCHCSDHTEAALEFPPPAVVCRQACHLSAMCHA